MARWLALASILGLWSLAYLWGLGAGDIHSSIEAMRAVASRNMLVSGDWLVPMFNGIPYLAKPPLTNWLIALTSLPGGEVTAFTARLPSALAALATAFVLYAWMRRRAWSAGTAGAAGLLFLVMPMVIAKGLSANIDIELTALVSASLWCFFESTRQPLNANRRVVAAYVLLALAVLAKGPPALVFFIAAVGSYQTLIGWRRAPFRAHYTGLLVFLAMVLAWLVPVIFNVGWDTFADAFRREALERITDAAAVNHEPIYFYPLSIFFAALPATVLALFARRRGLTADQAALWQFALGWLLGAIVLFSLSDAKEGRYLLPAYPALAVLGAIGLARLARPGARVDRTRQWLHRRLGPTSRRPLVVMAAAAASLIVLKIVLLVVIVPDRNARTSPRALAARLEQVVPAGATIQYVSKYRVAFTFYYQRPVHEYRNLGALADALASAPGPHYVLLLETLLDDAGRAQLTQRLRIIGEQRIDGPDRAYQLLQVEPRVVTDPGSQRAA